MKAVIILYRPRCTCYPLPVTSDQRHGQYQGGSQYKDSLSCPRPGNVSWTLQLHPEAFLDIHITGDNLLVQSGHLEQHRESKTAR